jgi:hypothetical protein
MFFPVNVLTKICIASADVLKNKAATRTSTTKNIVFLFIMRFSISHRFKNHYTIGLAVIGKVKVGRDGSVTFRAGMAQ